MVNTCTTRAWRVCPIVDMAAGQRKRSASSRSVTEYVLSGATLLFSGVTAAASFLLTQLNRDPAVPTVFLEIDLSFILLLVLAGVYFCARGMSIYVKEVRKPPITSA